MVMRRRRTYGGGNVLSKGVFIDIISHAQAQGRMSLGCDELLSKAKCDAEGRTNIHEEVKGMILSILAYILSGRRKSHVVCFSSMDDQEDRTLPGMSDALI